MKKLTTGEITQAAIDHFTNCGFFCWRNNQIPQRGRPFRGLKGVSDIIGFRTYSDGAFLACEVKNDGDILSQEQKDFLCSVNRAGGYAYLAEPDGNGGIKYRLYTDKK
ncbi:MAG: VRR-NUC domain-containing protein [Nitrososphaeraceae archaeon]|nr:VRR-NUC domain-containing protein [Nitrososphaeraceae archaeon]